MSKLQFEVIVATMNQKDLSLWKKMNISSNTIFVNQAGKHAYEVERVEGRTVKMLTTDTKGVGRNRNLGIALSTADVLLFSDDDLTYIDNLESEVLAAFNELPNAEMIIFSCNDVKSGKVVNTIQNKKSKARLFNSLKHGACTLAIRRETLLKYNLSFNEMFGGGTDFSSGEDTIFIKECFDHKVRIYKHDLVIADISVDRSSWFNGYNEKLFYDKGILLKRLFPAMFLLYAFYYSVKFSKISRISFWTILYWILIGARNFKTLKTYETYKTIQSRFLSGQE